MNNILTKLFVTFFPTESLDVYFLLYINSCCVINSYVKDLQENVSWDETSQNRIGSYTFQV